MFVVRFPCRRHGKLFSWQFPKVTSPLFYFFPQRFLSPHPFFTSPDRHPRTVGFLSYSQFSYIFNVAYTMYIYIWYMLSPTHLIVPITPSVRMSTTVNIMEQ